MGSASKPGAKLRMKSSTGYSGTTRRGCTRRWPMSARRGSSKTGLPINQSKPIRDSAMGYGFQGQGQFSVAPHLHPSTPLAARTPKYQTAAYQGETAKRKKPVDSQGSPCRGVRPHRATPDTPLASANCKKTAVRGGVWHHHHLATAKHRQVDAS